MGSYYCDWGAWGYVQKGASNWNDDALADNGEETSDVIDLDQKLACEIGVKLVEDNTGAIDGVVTVFILRATGDDGGGDEEYEESGVGSPLSFTITPVQNDTVRKAFTIDPHVMRRFKVSIKNEGGQELAVTVEYRTAIGTTA